MRPQIRAMLDQLRREHELRLQRRRLAAIQARLQAEDLPKITPLRAPVADGKLDARPDAVE